MKILIKLNFIVLFFLSLTCIETIAQNNNEIWEERYNKGNEALGNGNYKNAKVHLEKAYEIAKKNFDKNSEKLEKTAFKLGVTFDELGDYKNALKFHEESLLIMKTNGQDNTSKYAKRLCSIGIIHRIAGNYNKACESLSLSLNLLQTLTGKSNNDYVINLYQLSIAYNRKGDFKEAINTAKEAVEIAKDLNLKDLYALCLTALSQGYSQVSQIDNAIKSQELALNLYMPAKKQSVNYAGGLNNLAMLYFNIGDYNKSISFFKEILEILPKNHPGYASVKNNLAETYKRKGDYEKALSLINESISLSKDHNSASYANKLQNLAFLYVKLGDYEKALYNYKQAQLIFGNTIGKDHHLYGKLLNNIGKLYFWMGDFNTAKNIFSESLSNFLKNSNKSHPSYGYYMNDYANALLELGKHEEAIALLKENVEFSEKNSETENEDFFKKQFNLANAYNKTKNYQAALALLKNATLKTKNKLGAKHSDYGRMLKSLGTTYLSLNEIEKAIPVIDTSNQILINEIDNVFKFRSEKEKKSFLETINKNFNQIQSIAFHLKNPSDLLNSINLNNQTLLKGLLLNNSKNILSSLSTINDSLIDSKILSYRSLKNHYSKTLSLPPSERVLDTDSLSEIINNKEVELVKLYNSHFENKNITLANWKSSQSKLNSNDLAIEFSHFRLSTNSQITDSIIYVAYLYKSGWKTPEMIPLFEEKELKTILNKKSPTQLYISRGSKAKNISISTDIYDLVWKPLEKVTSASETIYFSPSGLLNQISFAALANDNSPSLSVKHNLIQLSNLGVLSKDTFEPEPTNTLFIGGVIYDYKKTLSDTITNKNSLNSKSTKNKAIEVNENHWNYLPGTLKEIHYLENIFLSNKKQYVSLIAENANEVNFKKLSGNSPNIIHIATHGFFHENIKPLNSSNLNTEEEHKLSEDPLMRSGLILAGANYSWKQGYNPHEEEDGILTALEISNLDLSNTDMVVLSACETGLGDIDGSEGVYGLQRAFKMAGVDIIVMSLWQVPDEETAEFMNLFYTNWLSSNKVKQAFNRAQRTMQAKYKHNPEKWAAFVLFE